MTGTDQWPFQLAGEGRESFGDLGVGIAFTTGNEKGTAANPALGSFKSAAQDTIYSYLTNAMDPAQTVFALKRHTRVNPQLYYYLGPFGLLAEYTISRQDVRRALHAPRYPKTLSV